MKRKKTRGKISRIYVATTLAAQQPNATKPTMIMLPVQTQMSTQIKVLLSKQVEVLAAPKSRPFVTSARGCARGFLCVAQPLFRRLAQRAQQRRRQRLLEVQQAQQAQQQRGAVTLHRLALMDEVGDAFWHQKTPFLLRFFHTVIIAHLSPCHRMLASRRGMDK